MTRKTFKARINGESMAYTVFEKGDRVSNNSGANGTVNNINGLLIGVTWDENSPCSPGMTWLATSLSLID